MTVTLRVEGLKELEHKLSKLDGNLPKVLGNVALAVGQEVRRVARTYPKQNHTIASEMFSFESDKQRRWFFANLREGKIQVPYKRSNKLKNNWELTSEGTKAVVENAVPYAPFVHGPERQTAMMAAIGWPTTQEIVDDIEGSGKVRRIVERVIDMALKRLGLT